MIKTISAKTITLTLSFIYTHRAIFKYTPPPQNTWGPRNWCGKLGVGVGLKVCVGWMQNQIHVMSLYYCGSIFNSSSPSSNPKKVQNPVHVLGLKNKVGMHRFLGLVEPPNPHQIAIQITPPQSTSLRSNAHPHSLPPPPPPTSKFKSPGCKIRVGVDLVEKFTRLTICTCLYVVEQICLLI